MQRTNTNILSALLKEFVKEEGLEEGLLRVRISKAWDVVVGRKYAVYTTSKFFNNGVLYCTISSSIVRNQLFFRRDDIVFHLNKELGEEIVKNVVLR